MMTREGLKKYKRDGFVVKKGLVNYGLFETLLRVFIKILRKYNLDFPERLNNCKSWNDDLLIKTLINFRKKKPEMFGIFYDSLQNSSVLQALFTQQTLMDVNMASKFDHHEFSLSELTTSV